MRVRVRGDVRVRGGRWHEGEWGEGEGWEVV